MQRGDVVRVKNGQRCRVLHIEEEPGTVYYSGVWEKIDAPEDVPEWKRRERFALCFVQFYSVEANGQGRAS